MQDPLRNAVVPVEVLLPAADERVIVVCPGCRCLGYLDEQGVWRDNAHADKLEGVTGWLKLTAA